MNSKGVHKRYNNILEQLEENHAINDEKSLDINSRVLIIDGL